VGVTEIFLICKQSSICTKKTPYKRKKVNPKKSTNTRNMRDMGRGVEIGGGGRGERKQNETIS